MARIPFDNHPHYHCIIFNLPLSDLQVLKIRDGHIYYTSKELDGVWNKGYSIITEVSAETCAYVAQYCVKKAFGTNIEDFRSLGVEKEFITMSRRPGIGFDWIRSHPEVIDSPVINVSTSNGGRQFVIPRYFLEKLSEIKENGNFVELIKSVKHDYYLNRLQIEDSLSTKPRTERLLDQERVKIKSIRKVRDLDER